MERGSKATHLRVPAMRIFRKQAEKRGKVAAAIDFA
jgi:hypothetical protein